MSDTPISDSTPHNVADLGMLCRTLERLAAVRLDYINQLEANNNAANAEIERLKKSNLQLREGAEEQKQRIHSLIAERDTAQTYADQKWKLRREFHDLFGTDDVEQAVAVVRDMNDRIKRLEDWKQSQLEVEREWNANAIATMLGGKLGESQRKVIQREVPLLLDRIKRLEEFASRFLNPDDLGWAIGKYDRDEAREALGKERVESK